MKLLKHYKAYSLAMYVFLIFIHFILKDYLFPLSVIFYAAPLILIIILGFFVVFFFRKKKMISITVLILQLVMCYHWFNNYYFIQIPKTPIQTESVLFWNVAKKQQLYTRPIINTTKNHNSTIITLVEAINIKAQDLDSLKMRLPNYSFIKLKGDMFLGVKGSVDAVTYKYVDRRYKFNHIITTINNEERSILIVDIYASPFINKEQPIIEVLNYAKANTIDIIVGDFNTPYESIHFNNYVDSYSSFHGYGNGVSATWPHHIPLLELDQVWITKSLIPHSLKTYKYGVSDHKLLIANYSKN